MLRLRRAFQYVFLLHVTYTAPAQRISDFYGTWVFRVEGQNIFKLSLLAKEGNVGGTLTKPRRFKSIRTEASPALDQIRSR